MAIAPTVSSKTRPARIRVPHRERVLFTISDHRFVGILQRLSLTGGSVIHSEEPPARGTVARLDLKTVFGKVTAKIEFLHVGADGSTPAQAFRFISMDESCARRLTVAIERMQRAGYSDTGILQKGLRRLISQSLSTVLAHLQRSIRLVPFDE
jgi:hypothetical protein